MSCARSFRKSTTSMSKPHYEIIYYCVYFTFFHNKNKSKNSLVECQKQETARVTERCDTELRGILTENEGIFEEFQNKVDRLESEVCLLFYFISFSWFFPTDLSVYFNNKKNNNNNNNNNNRWPLLRNLTQKPSAEWKTVSNSNRGMTSYYNQVVE